MMKAVVSGGVTACVLDAYTTRLRKTRAPIGGKQSPRIGVQRGLSRTGFRGQRLRETRPRSLPLNSSDLWTVESGFVGRGCDGF